MKTTPYPPQDRAPNLSDNRLLSQIPAADAQRWTTRLQLVELALGDVLSESGSVPEYVYFPTTAIVSLVYTTSEGDCSEVAVVGCDGLVGIAVVMGGNAMPSQAVVQSAGQAWRLPSRWVRDEIAASPLVLMVMLGYARAMLAQVARTAACNRYHTIDQLLCRRLLMGLDRSSGTQLVMTQELVANLLGVRREGVTGAALRLQQAGVIRYSRGHIAVLDRVLLEAGTRCAAAASRALPMRTTARSAQAATA